MNTVMIFWKKLSTKINEAISMAVFAMIYFIVIGIYALVAFVIKLLKLNSQQSAGWHNKFTRLPTLENFKRQF